MRLRSALLTLTVTLALPGAALADVNPVPEADHVRIECGVLRLNVNDYSIRHQLKLLVTISATDESRFSGAELALLSIVNPRGEEVTIGVRDYQFSPRKFKAAHAKLLFKAVDDSAAPFPSEISNVPAGFFDGGGPFALALTLRGEEYRGEISFAEQLGMQLTQAGQPVGNFCLQDEESVELLTVPTQFGPVYYKRQDLTNFVFQMANMDQALADADYHAPVEPTKYFFQLRVGDAAGGPTRLIDPARYIEGYQPHMIRSELTTTPLAFGADEFDVGEVVLVDFMRQDTLAPGSVFSAPHENFSSQTVVQDRVVFALRVESPPTPEELGQLPAGAEPVD